VLALLFSVGCGGSQYGKIGPAYPLPNGSPGTDCERAAWFDIAPARIQATGATIGVGVNTYYTQEHEGLGVFRHGSKDPEDLEDLLPTLGEPDLAQRHQARIEPVDAASRRAVYWSVGGLVGLFGGIGVAAAVQKDSPSVAAAFGISGLVLGLVGVVGALASQPSGEDQLYADARRKLLIRGEDDPRAITRGINDLNGRQRVKCGGRSIPFRDDAIEINARPNPYPAPSSPSPEN
jgi:hypothetical protein